MKKVIIIYILLMCLFPPHTVKSQDSPLEDRSLLPPILWLAKISANLNKIASELNEIGLLTTNDAFMVKACYTL